MNSTWLTNKMKTFIFTCGDVNGIGPEIVVKTLNRLKNSNHRFVFIIPENAFEKAAGIVKPSFDYLISKGEDIKNDHQVIINVLKKIPLNTGEATIHSGKASFDAIHKAFKLIKKNHAHAVVTAPISKLSLKLAGIKYPGHTEMFADWCKVKNYVMMFLSDNFYAALNSIHIPLKKVPDAVTIKNIQKKLVVVIDTLKYDFKILYPKAAVLGLNPHSGENGIIGEEEKKIIKPALAKISEADGPFPPDAFFAKKLYRNYDVVFGMYHDQLLIPFKLMNFNKGVNYTAGLPVVRTSPDHGTAFDIAGCGSADETSMAEAFRYAELIVRNREPNES